MILKLIHEFYTWLWNLKTTNTEEELEQLAAGGFLLDLVVVMIAVGIFCAIKYRHSQFKEQEYEER